MRLPILFLALLSAVFLSGCAALRRPQPVVSAAATAATAASLRREAAKAEEAEAARLFANASGKPRIKISLGSQRASFFKGGKLVTTSRISSGKDGFRTPRGHFSITQKDIDHKSGTYGSHVDGDGTVLDDDVDSRKDRVPPGARYVGASMPYFMRFNHGIGMHAGRVPEYAASHGCVRLPAAMARLFFEHAPTGTPVTVTD